MFNNTVAPIPFIGSNKKGYSQQNTFISATPDFIGTADNRPIVAFTGYYSYDSSSVVASNFYIGIYEYTNSSWTLKGLTYYNQGKSSAACSRQFICTIKKGSQSKSPWIIYTNNDIFTDSLTYFIDNNINDDRSIAFDNVTTSCDFIKMFICTIGTINYVNINIGHLINTTTNLGRITNYKSDGGGYFSKPDDCMKMFCVVNFKAKPSVAIASNDSCCYIFWIRKDMDTNNTFYLQYTICYTVGSSIDGLTTEIIPDPATSDGLTNYGNYSITPCSNIGPVAIVKYTEGTPSSSYIIVSYVDTNGQLSYYKITNIIDNANILVTDYNDITTTGPYSINDTSINGETIDIKIHWQASEITNN